MTDSTKALLLAFKKNGHLKTPRSKEAATAKDNLDVLSDMTLTESQDMQAATAVTPASHSFDTPSQEDDRPSAKYRNNKSKKLELDHNLQQKLASCLDLNLGETDTPMG